MKTCNDHVAFFTSELDTLGNKPFRLRFAEFLEVLRYRKFHEADAACRVFAATLQWPAVQEKTRLELCMRLDCARWYCEEHPDMELDQRGQEFLEDLLVDYWIDEGKRNWIHDNYCLTPEEKQEYRAWLREQANKIAETTRKVQEM